MNKKILIVTHWFYPFNVPRAFRATALAEELYKRGYNTDVVVAHTQEKFNMKDFSKNNHIERSQVSKFKSKYASKMNKIFEYFFGERFYYKNFNLLNDIDFKEYSIIISIGLPFYIHRIVSRKIKKGGTNQIYISDWSDPYFNSHVKLAWYFKGIQKKTLDAFDYVVVPIPDVNEYFSEFVDSKKIRNIPQGFDLTNINLAKFKENDVVNFAYAGIFYTNIRNPKYLLEYLSKQNIKFIFHIYTLKKGEIYENELKEYQEKLGNKMIIHDIIPRDELLYHLSKMDFLLNLENESQNQVPSKLIDYAITGRPILSIKPDLSDTSTINQFLNRDYSNSVKIDITKYDIKNVVDRFVDLFGEAYEG